MYRALVTGASGFLGRYIVSELLNRKFKVVCYDVVAPPHEGNFEFVRGDVRDQKTLKKAMRGCKYVFHNAAIADIDDAVSRPVETMEVNVVGTANCLEVARRSQVKRFVLASTVYVESEHGSFYRISKQACELLCKAYNQEFGLPYTIVRYGSLYGRKANDWNMVRQICYQLMAKKVYRYYGSGEELREFINVRDAARETVNVALNSCFRNQTVLITGNQKMRMKDFFKLVEEIIPHPVKIVYDDRKHRHYRITPYKLVIDKAVRINLQEYVDIGEGILDCLEEIAEEMGKKKVW